ncbi:HD domain-containing protein [Paenibacillus larvae]|nr:HD domain-containing phosphohydrolase [Paenibacillus larvae]MCY9690413.1 HD domain-containing protein [Paenibacillus larvae]
MTNKTFSIHIYCHHKLLEVFMQIAELRIARHDAAVRTENGGGEEVKNSRLFVEKQLLAFEEDYHIKKWVDFLRYKHPDTYMHCKRVALLAGKLADSFLFDLAKKDQLVKGCFLHDLGKAYIPLHILNQKESLSKQQWEIVKLHTSIGAELLESIPRIDPAVIDVIRYHHERWDGKGYPEGLAGDNIPLFARIFTVVDSFDTMISDRPYRKKLPVEEARNRLLQHGGTQFDSAIVHCFLSLTDEALELDQVTDRI